MPYIRSFMRAIYFFVGKTKYTFLFFNFHSGFILVQKAEYPGGAVWKRFSKKYHGKILLGKN